MWQWTQRQVTAVDGVSAVGRPRPARRTPMMVVLGIAAGPLLWAACGEPGPASTPGGWAPPPSPSGAEDSPPTPAAFASALAAIPRFDVGDSLSKEECEELHRRAVDARMAAEDAALQCAADSDCGKVNDEFCGQWMCSLPVAKASEGKFNADFARIQKVTCPAWTAGGCPQKAPLPMPSCANASPRCEAGRCTFAF